MALIGNIIIGFQANLRGLDKGAADARRTVSGFQSGAAGGFAGIGAASDNLASKIAAGMGVYNLAAGAAGRIKDAFVGGIKGASDLNETLSMTNAVLGSSAPAAIKFAEKMATEFGLVKQETLEGAAAIGGLGKSLGNLSGGKLDDFTLKMTKLAADLQSSKNLGSLKEATDAIGIGLAGNQSDVLKSMGVVMTEASVKAYAAANGIGTVGKALSEEEKLATRAAMITDRLSFAHNDLENTSGGAANQFRKFSGGLQNFANDIGQMLLPAVTAATTVINGLIAKAQAGFNASKAAFERWGAGLLGVVNYAIGTMGDLYAGAVTVVGKVLGAFSPLVSGVGGVFSAIGAKVMEFMETARFVGRNMGPIWEIARLMTAEKIANMGAVISAFATNVVTLGSYIGRNWSSLVVDGVNAASAAFVNFGTNLGNLGSAVMAFFKDPTKGFKFEWTPLLEGFKGTAEKLPTLVGPAFVSLQDEIDAQLAVIGENETSRANAMAQGLSPGLTKAVTDKAKVDAKAPAAPDDGKKQFAGLAEMGSKEAFKTLAQFQSGGDREDGIKAVARNGREHIEVAKDTLTAIKAISTGGNGAATYSFA